jgi:cell division protein FtsN
VSDEGFREIQLNGKQLIFLFMAVTVVLVVTFLFGVLTGRDVRQSAAATEIASDDVTPGSGLASAESAVPPQQSGGGDPNQAPAAPASEKLSYPDRLLGGAAVQEDMKPTARAEQPRPAAPIVQEPVAEKLPAAPPPAKEKPTPAPAPPARTPQAAAVPASPAAPQASDPSGPGFAVQVAAYRDRRDADTLAKQLSAKGYPAFVMDPVKGTSTALFRVRVGKFRTQKDAEAVEMRLQTAEQLTNAWIAR